MSSEYTCNKQMCNKRTYTKRTYNKPSCVKRWFQYVVFGKIKKPYVGSTVDLNKRIRQHNREIKGGAKWTRGDVWHYYSVVFNVNNYKNICLSEEWHVKYFNNRKVKKSRNLTHKMMLALEMYYRTRPHISEPYDYVMFISKKYATNYLPMIDKRTFIFIVEDFSMENIINHLNMLKTFLEYCYDQLIYKSSTDGSKYATLL